MTAFCCIRTWVGITDTWGWVWGCVGRKDCIGGVGGKDGIGGTGDKDGIGGTGGTGVLFSGVWAT